MAIAVGKEAFTPYLPLGMASAEQSLQIDAAELHEFTYAFFGTVAKARLGRTILSPSFFPLPYSSSKPRRELK